MNKYIIFLVIIFLSVSLFGQDKKRIVVLETQGTASAAERDEIKNALIRGIRNNGNFSVVAQNELSQIIQQQGLQMKDYFNEDQAIEVGRLAQAQYICMSSVNTSNEYDYRISYRLIDIETGETLEGTDVREKATKVNFYDVVDKIADSKLFVVEVKDNSTTVFICGCEVQKEDLPQDAKIPPGWRLPTIAELKCICENKEKIGGFNFGTYMSSTKQGGNFKGIKFQFCDEVFVMNNSSMRVVKK